MTVGAGTVIGQNDVYGYFSIPDVSGNAGNPEVIVKMVDATAIGQNYWVFYGCMTDLEYTLDVKEIATGVVKTMYGRRRLVPELRRFLGLQGTLRDTFTRSHGLITEDDAVAQMRLFADAAHAVRMAWIGHLDDDRVDHRHIRANRNAIVEEAGVQEPPFVVVDSPPARSNPILFVGAAAAQILCSRDLIAIIQVVNRMENCVSVRNVDDRPIRLPVPRLDRPADSARRVGSPCCS